MNTLHFRNFQKKDTQRLAELAVDAWPIVSSLVPVDDIPKIMKAYLEINRIGSTWHEIATINDRVVGFLFGKLEQDQQFIDKIRAIIPNLYILFKIIIGRYGRLSEPFIFLEKLNINLKN
jgi:hypothetical protein